MSSASDDMMVTLGSRQIGATFPAYLPNYIDPITQRSLLKALTLTLGSLALILVSLRVYTKIFMLRTFGKDDGKVFQYLIIIKFIDLFQKA